MRTQSTPELMSDSLRLDNRTRVNKRVLVAGVAITSMIVGAVAGAGATLVASALLSGPLVPYSLLRLGAAIGIGVGFVSGPLLAFTILRREPIGVSLLRSFVGALIGGALGIWLGFEAINPYEPLTLFRAPIWQATVGALVGAGLLALHAHQRSRRLQSRHTSPTS